MKKYINGEYIELTPEEVEKLKKQSENDIEEITQLDKIEAQVIYTAMMTNTLLEGE